MFVRFRQAGHKLQTSLIETQPLPERDPVGDRRRQDDRAKTCDVLMPDLAVDAASLASLYLLDDASAAQHAASVSRPVPHPRVHLLRSENRFAVS
jgi:hypothetical protein